MNIQPESAKIIDLRCLLREKFPEAHPRDGREPGAGGAAETQITSVHALDAIGIARGTITEIVSSCLSAGNALLIHGLLLGAAQREQHIALVDGRDAFDPQSAGPEACGTLLWVRCHSAAEAIVAADLILRDGNLALVAMDLQLNPLRELGRLPASSWHRLRSLAEKSGATLIALTPQRLIASAHLRVALDGNHPLDALETPRKNLQNSLIIKLMKNRNAQSELAEPPGNVARHSVA